MVLGPLWFRFRFRVQGLALLKGPRGDTRGVGVLWWSLHVRCVPHFSSNPARTHACTHADEAMVFRVYNSTGGATAGMGNGGAVRCDAASRAFLNSDSANNNKYSQLGALFKTTGRL